MKVRQPSRCLVDRTYELVDRTYEEAGQLVLSVQAIWKGHF